VPVITPRTDSLAIANAIVYDTIFEASARNLYDRYISTKINSYAVHHSQLTGLIPCDVSFRRLKHENVLSVVDVHIDYWN
jgi:hypothetical protein